MKGEKTDNTNEKEGHEKYKHKQENGGNKKQDGVCKQMKNGKQAK